MNDFVSLLVATLVFCIGYWASGLAVWLAIRFQIGPVHLAEGSLAQVALALALGLAAWRRAVQHRGARAA
ncbi:hypothetical protein OPKNFCMD_2128 [Methylobacterium crusticola]|uniref:Uncharacterized protein n=1 Tax=Methylobacterium crusticola TaxID=1697972 RepID=A0ABQ4QVT8_9HYPH|nr:hypothetical protein [Methylobacterium crusticola]GJD49398.1 hypothetical protein OPKNFCMD_2128 [Methylobacterium crusticola]